MLIWLQFSLHWSCVNSMFVIVVYIGVKIEFQIEKELLLDYSFLLIYLNYVCLAKKQVKSTAVFQWKTSDKALVVIYSVSFYYNSWRKCCKMWYKLSVENVTRPFVTNRNECAFFLMKMNEHPTDTVPASLNAMWCDFIFQTCFVFWYGHFEALVWPWPFMKTCTHSTCAKSRHTQHVEES